MAEKGVDDSISNPFSFKGFVNGSKADISNEEQDDIFGLNKKREKSSDDKIMAVEHDIGHDTQKPIKKKEKQKENPFSFKKFLSTPNKSSKDSLSLGSGIDIASNSPSFTSTSTKFTEDGARAESDQQTLTIGEDFDFHPTLPSSFSSERIPPLHPSDLLSHEFSSKKKSKHIEIVPDDREDSLGLGLASGVSLSSSSPNLGLPDFLSDGAALNAGVVGSNSSPERCRSLSQNEDLHIQIRMIQEENERLRKELSREKQKCSEKNQKLSQLKIDLERQKKKEAEETAVMEQAVLKVEETLVATTSRAVQAEANVARFKQETKALQTQVTSLSAEVEILKSGDAGLADLRERTKYSSEQLRDAAISAERNLKELLAGVDKLKLVSLVLASLEKVSDVKDSGQGSSESEQQHL